MQHQNVNSSVIKSIGYDSEQSIVEIRFKRNDQLWQYEKVPKDAYNRLIGADSVGGHFMTQFRGNYIARRVKENNE